MRQTSLILACVVAIGGMTAHTLAARAAPGPSTVNVVVSAKGLDLTTEKDVRRFLMRLARGASVACGGQVTSSPLLPRASDDFRQCRAQALADVVARSNLPRLQRQFATTNDAARLRVAAR
jgi:UrcA family protein